jgi:hypothetical protein
MVNVYGGWIDDDVLALLFGDGKESCSADGLERNGSGEES